MKPVVLMTDSHAIQNEEVEVIHLPFIGTRSLPIVKALHHNQYDWLIFTSKNAVHRFFRDYPDINAKHIASIGSKTSELLKSMGYQIDYEPTIFNQETFIEEAHDRFDNQLVCLPCSRAARPLIHRYLMKRSTVDRIDLYEPYERTENILKAHQLIGESAIDYIAFLSPSAVRSYFSISGPITIPVIAIGDVTGRALSDFNQPYILSDTSTKESIFTKILEMERIK